MNGFRNLRGEIAVFLNRQGPSTTTAVSVGIRARRAAVDEILAAYSEFVEAPTPEGANPRARHWTTAAVASQAVQPRVAGQGRAALMLAVLSDGREHTRADIFRLSGRFFLTNNAATELRRQSFDVQQKRVGLDYVYWLAAAVSRAA